jgi:N-acetylneuraminate synthase
MKSSFEIRGHPIGDGAPTYIISEAGSNHNGSLARALQLIEVAAECGSDAVKFQTFKASRLYPRSAGTSDYLGDPTPIYDIIAALEMPEEWLGELSQRAHDLGLAFISSPFDEEAVVLLDPHVDAFKIASYELTHEPLLKAVASRGKPVIMSTGASRLEEVEQSVKILREAGCEELALLQCTASYPTPLEAVNVRALVSLREKFEIPTGLSDHSRDPVIAPVVAAALGAAVVEKHYTLSNELPGPDHAYALEPHELAMLVKSVREVDLVMGSGEKDVHQIEQELRHFARRSIFTTCSIKAGDLLTRENVDILRRGKLAEGLAPGDLSRVLGRRAACDIDQDTPLVEEHLAETEGWS